MSLWLTIVKIMYTVYILKSLKASKIYVGYTEIHPKDRLEQHNAGSNKWTKIYSPFKLIYYETFICKADAIRREKFFKTGQGFKLKKLIADNYGV